MMKNNNYVYFAEIERFGYTLQVIGKTEKECKDAINICDEVNKYGTGDELLDIINILKYNWDMEL